MNELEQLDQETFEVINGSLSNQYLDSVMPVLTDLHRLPFFWVVLAIVLGLWIWKHKKRALTAIFGLALSILVSETISYRLVKSYVARPRPEFTSGVEVQLKTHSHSGKSFPSLHASNNFAGATFVSFIYPKIAPLLLSVAMLIAFSRVYVGVHFPGDVLAGALIGIFCALLVRTLLARLKVTKVHLS